MNHKTIKILMFPWLAHGHISPFLELAKKLAKRNFSIQFCSTPTNLSSIKEKLAADQSEKFSQSIQLVELHLPNLPELPPHYHSTKSLPPHLMPTLKKAFEMAKPDFSNLLKHLKPDLVIYDSIQPWVPETALQHNIPAVEFVSIGAAMTSFMLHVIKNPGADFPFPEIYVHGYEKSQIAHLMESALDPEKDKDRPTECLERSCDIILIKTFKELEGKYFDYLSDLLKKKIVAVGPLVEDIVGEDHQEIIHTNTGSVLDWLNQKDKCSTVFVCFGSELFLCKEEMEEIAIGLELSDVNFIWALRFPKGEERRVEEVLPEGFLERVGERGMVISGWAPQAKILEHENIGGFVSHCGWSSVMEAMKSGVPIIAVPLVYDQPVNAKVLENVGVGLEVVKDEDGRIQREKLAEAIKQVMGEETGETLRRKARSLSQKIRSKGEEEIDGVVEELVKACNK